MTKIKKKHIVNSIISWLTIHGRVKADMFWYVIWENKILLRNILLRNKDDYKKSNKDLYISEVRMKKCP